MTFTPNSTGAPLKGDDGQKTWTGWAILTYNLDTLTIRTA